MVRSNELARNVTPYAMSNRRKNARKPQKPAAPPSLPLGSIVEETPWRRLQSAAKWMVTFVAGAATLGFFQVFDVYGDTIPKLELRTYAQSPGYELLPFLIKNPSRLFNMQDVRIVCFVHSATFSGEGLGKPHSYAYAYNSQDFDERATFQITIRSGETTNFPCDLKSRKLERPGADVVAVHQRIGMTYVTQLLWFKIKRNFCSQSYFGVSTKQGFNWIEGNVLHPRSGPVENRSERDSSFKDLVPAERSWFASWVHWFKSIGPELSGRACWAGPPD
jgi:hypothetical protein